MTIKELNIDDFSKIYSSHMIYDFPSAELKPLTRIIQTMKEGLCSALGLYENNHLKGYAIFIIPKNSNYALLDYFAILKDNRRKGYGHQFFSCISSFFKQYFPHLNGFFIECENIEKAENKTEQQIRTRRIAFYKDNGALETSLMSCLFGVEYIILFFPCSRPDTASYDNFETVNFIYQSMFKKHHYENQVSLWKKEHAVL